ncbi:hypothetical protein [Thiorhodococcus minor]|uniref:Uncharacterized protein n=1 Tax=Thiorhodococcus minor TaxID=57489 RepID=A0A6M0K659_9GAMM|nr:hypothetical protein [Thiorhodococcus minor]NEV64801.1 hypothetical protein [Thiorhodococcus minor]
MPNFDPTFVFHRLVQDDQALDGIVADRCLDQELFVERHRHTIARHYASEGLHLEEAKTRQLAEDLWTYMHHLMSLTRRKTAAARRPARANPDRTVNAEGQGNLCRDDDERILFRGRQRMDIRDLESIQDPRPPCSDKPPE